MQTISANEHKTSGIGAIARALDHELEVELSVRGHLRYVVMSADAYQRLRDCELEIALQETRADLAAGHLHADTVDDHLRRLRHHQTAPSPVRFHVRKGERPWPRCLPRKPARGCTR